VDYDDEPQEQTIPEEELGAKADELVLALREAGVYEDRCSWIDAGNGVPSLMMEMYVGDIAFSPRVQDREQWGIDAEFREMAAELKADAWEEYRERAIKELRGE
jgi:hypothetical protein